MTRCLQSHPCCAACLTEGRTEAEVELLWCFNLTVLLWMGLNPNVIGKESTDEKRLTIRIETAKIAVDDMLSPRMLKSD